ncbi:putative polygalacturonase [Serratia phage vB_SmaM_Haymo]|nr:putative polygalacturonase [Serratia phage vB_SmaM_Haymo]
MVDQVKISELGKATVVRESDAIPLNNTTTRGLPITRQADITNIRSAILFNDAFNSIEEGLDITNNGDSFYVYNDADKLTVARYLKINDVASPVVGENGKQIIEGTGIALKTIGDLGGPFGFGVVGRVDSYDSLRNLVPTKEGQVVYLNGFHSGSHLGGGAFISSLTYSVDDGGTVASVSNGNYSWKRLLGNEINLEMFGAVGDGVNVDNDSIDNALAFCKLNGKSDNNIIVKLTRNYRVNKSFELTSFTSIIGPGEIFIDSQDLTLILFTGSDLESLLIQGLIISRAVDKPATMWSKGATAIQLTRVKDLTIRDNDISLQTDAISVSNSDRVLIENNKTHELGEEGIAIRSSRNFIVRGNHVFHHHGDGILMKTGNIECHDGQIVDNFVYDGLIDPVAAVGQRGGGITLNDENINGAGGSSTTMDGLVVSRNTCRNLSYGIAFNNLTSAVIQGNIITGVTRFGLVIDTTPFNNPALNPVLRFSVSGNILKDIGEVGIGFRSNRGITVDYVSVTGNVIENAGYKTNGDFPSLDIGTGTVTGNTVVNGRVAIMASGNALINANQFIGSPFTSPGANSVWIKLSESVTFSNNLVKDTNMGHIRMSATKNMIFTNNNIDTASTYGVLAFVTSGLPYGHSMFRDNIYITKAPSVCNFTIGADSIRSLGLSRAEFGNNDYMYDSTLSSLVNYKKGDRISLVAPEGGASTYVVIDETGKKAAVEFTPYYVKSNTFTQSVPANGTAVIVAQDSKVKGTWAVGKVWCSVNRNGVMIQCDCTKDGEVTIRFVNTTAATVTLTNAVVTLECFEMPNI